MGFSDSLLLWGLRQKLYYLHDDYNKLFKILPAEPLDLPPHVKPTDFLEVIETSDSHVAPDYRAVSQFSYEHDIEGYKGGRLLYFKAYEMDFSRPDLQRDIAVYCNCQLFYDPDDKLVWPIIKSIEDMYSDSNFQKRVGTINWKTRQRKQLIGKPYNNYAYNRTWKPIPKHFVRVIANQPGFKALYDEQEMVASAPHVSPIQHQVQQEPRDEPPVSIKSDTTVTDDDDFGRDQY